MLSGKPLPQTVEKTALFLREQHLAAVDEKSLYQRVRRQHIGQHCADQHGVREDHGHRHEPVPFHSCGKQAAEQQRKQRKQYFHDKAVSAAIERSRQQKEEQ